MKKFTINENKSIEDSIKAFNTYGVNSLVVLGKDNKYLGTLTNGDIRRGILKTKSIKSKINDLYNKKSTYFYEDNYTEKELKSIFLKKGFDLIPILKKNNTLLRTIRIIDLFKKKQVTKKSIKGVQAIIMAGGLGTRMTPFTDILPKPLLPIHGKPVLQHILENLFSFGINKCWITLNYKSQLLKTYLRETHYKTKLNFYDEQKRLGTVGCVRNFKSKVSKTFILTNCDTIINTDYSELIKFHKKNRFDITIVSAMKEYEVPYGVCTTDKNQKFISLDEKPNIEVLINSGMYVMNRDVLDLIPRGKYDMTDLIKKSQKNKKNIGIYPIQNDDWTDVGNWEIYKKVLEKYS